MISWLATSWSYDTTKTVLTMKLRTDVKFTDGEPFNAAAAAQNLLRFRDGTSANKSYLTNVKDPKTVDDAIKLIVERTGAGFAGNATVAELATAVGALRPIARETTSLILAQEVERALRQLVDRGPEAVVWAAKR